MSMKIERSCDRGRFSPEEIARKVRESRAFWNSPAGKAQQRQLDAEAERRSKENRGIKFPSLARQTGTKPEFRDLHRLRAKFIQ